MKRWMALTVMVAGCGQPQVVEHPPVGQLDTIAWMQGTWRAEADGRVTDEVWVPTSERTWMGLNRTTDADGATAHHELLRMEVREDGVRYVAAPAGQSRTAFGMTASGEGEARFENPGHDFPTWIAYRRHRRTLVATIGNAESDEPAATWTFERTGDAPPLLDVPATVCRDGGTLRVEVPACQCGGQIFCAGFEVEGGTDVHLALVDSTCDACTETSGTCEVPDAEVVRINGRAVTRERGCVRPPVPLLTLLDP